MSFCERWSAKTIANALWIKCQKLSYQQQQQQKTNRKKKKKTIAIVKNKKQSSNKPERTHTHTHTQFLGELADDLNSTSNADTTGLKNWEMWKR